MATLCGPSQSGKSYLIEKIIRNHKTLIEPQIDKLIYLYSVDNYDGIKQYIRDNEHTSTLKTFVIYFTLLNFIQMSYLFTLI